MSPRTKKVALRHRAPRSKRRSPLRLLALWGGVMLALYVALFVLLQSSTLSESPTLVPDRWKAVFRPLRALFPREWTHAQLGGWVEAMNAGLYVLLLVGLFAAYLFALRRVFAARIPPATRPGWILAAIVGLTAVTLALLLIFPATFSKDLFNYVWYGRVISEYGDNPFLSVPSDYAWSDTSRWLQWTYWADTPSVYGPVWVALAGGTASVARAIDNDIVTHLLGHKVLYSVAHLVNVVLVWQVAQIVVCRYWQRPRNASVMGWQTAATAGVTLTYAWNPLAVVEFGLSGHNDVLLLTGLLAALWLHLTGHWRLAVVAIALASLVKVIGLVFLPGYLWLLVWEGKGDRRQRIVGAASRIAQAGLLVVVTWVVAYVPYWEGLATLKPLSGGPAANWYVNSIGAAIRMRLPEVISDVAWQQHLRPLYFWTENQVGLRLDWPARWGLLLISATVAALATWRARTFPAMLWGWGWALFAYLTIGSMWFWPWYVSWALVPVALLGPGRLWNAIQILCLTSLSLYAIVPRSQSVFKPLDGLAGLLIAVPPLAYVLGSLAVEAWRRRPEKEPPAIGHPVREGKRGYGMEVGVGK